VLGGACLRNGLVFEIMAMGKSSVKGGCLQKGNIDSNKGRRWIESAVGIAFSASKGFVGLGKAGKLCISRNELYIKCICVGVLGEVVGGMWE